MADFDTCWRRTEAAEASDTLHMESNQVDLSGKLYSFYWIFQVSFIFCCGLEQSYVNVLEYQIQNEGKVDLGMRQLDS